METKIKKESKRNGIISILKFILSILVVIYHGKKISGISKFKIVPLGYLCVDFFFIVSGYYFYKSILKLKSDTNIYKENVRMIVNKVKKFLPYTIISGIIGLIILFIFKKLKINNICMSIFNMFLLDMTGVKGFIVNGPIWYISAMLLVFFVLTPIIYKMKDKYIYYLCPIIVLFGLGYMYNTYPNLDLYRSRWNGILFSGIIKAFVEVNLGIMIYNISEYLKVYMKDKKKLYKYFLNFIYIILYLGVLTFLIFYKKAGMLDYFVLVIISITLVLNFADDILCSKFDSKFTRYLERLSLPIFINQQMFLNLTTFVSKKHQLLFSKYLIIYIFITILFSILEMNILDMIKNKIKTKNA